MLAVKITAKKDLKSRFTEVLETVPTVTGTSVQSITWCDLYKTHHRCPDTRPGTGVSACSGNRVGEWQSTDPGVPALSGCWEQLEKGSCFLRTDDWGHHRGSLPVAACNGCCRLIRSQSAFIRKCLENIFQSFSQWNNINLDQMLTNSLDHLSIHSILLWTILWVWGNCNIMPEQRTSFRLASSTFYWATGTS